MLLVDPEGWAAIPREATPVASVAWMLTTTVSPGPAVAGSAVIDTIDGPSKSTTRGSDLVTGAPLGSTPVATTWWFPSGADDGIVSSVLTVPSVCAFGWASR